MKSDAACACPTNFSRESAEHLMLQNYLVPAIQVRFGTKLAALSGDVRDDGVESRARAFRRAEADFEGDVRSKLPRWSRFRPSFAASVMHSGVVA